MNSPIKDVIHEFSKVKDSQQMKNLIEGLFTPAEIVEFSQRIQIVKLLKNNVPQHEIAKKLGVGVATVTRGSKEIQKGRFKSVGSSWRPSSIREASF